ncbi:MAG: hypothetical protein U0232_27925 [Thermomicrobiales bacterium]
MSRGSSGSPAATAHGSGADQLRAARRLPRPAAPRQPGPWKLAASSAWTGVDLRAKIWWHETPFARTLTCRFAGDSISVEWQPNAAFGPVDPAHLEGKIAQ